MKSNVNITVLDGMAANPGDITWEPLEALGNVTVYDVTPPDKLIERAINSDICITNKTVFDKDVIEALPALKYIGVLATGFNVVDLDACSGRGVVVTNVPEYSTYATAQMTVALMLELTNHAGIHNASVHNGDWIRSPQFCYWKKPLTELWNKTAVIVGYGKIGQRVCELLLALGMDVIAVPHDINNHPEDKRIRFMPLNEAIPLADIISFHCPLTNETRGIINKQFINNVKSSAFIINAARGALADEKELSEALAERKLQGYAADVVNVEPMAADNPLLTAPNVILTPHIAWAPKETRLRLINAAADNLRGYLNGLRGSKINQVG